MLPKADLTSHSRMFGSRWEITPFWLSVSWKYFLSFPPIKVCYEESTSRPRKLTQFSSVAQSCPTLCDPWTTARQASLSVTNCQSPPKPMSIESVIPSNHLILCHPFLLLPSIFPSIRVFSNESALLITWSKYWSFRFRNSLSSEYSRLISFWIDWFDLLAVQGTLKSLLQHHSSKSSVL